MFTSCFRPWLKNVSCLNSILSVGRTAIARAKCKSESRDLARVFLRVIYLVADQSVQAKSDWQSVFGRTCIVTLNNYRERMSSR